MAGKCWGHERVTVQVISPPTDAAVTATTDAQGVYVLSKITSTRFTVRYSYPQFISLDVDYSFQLGVTRTDLRVFLRRLQLATSEVGLTIHLGTGVAEHERGDDAMVRFWQGLATSPWQSAFQNAFGTAVAQFYDDFERNK